mgnify:CR=1 FL=1
MSLRFGFIGVYGHNDNQILREQFKSDPAEIHEFSLANDQKLILPLRDLFLWESERFRPEVFLACLFWTIHLSVITDVVRVYHGVSRSSTNGRFCGPSFR